MPPPVEVVLTELDTRDHEVAAEVANGIAAHRAKISFDDPDLVDFRFRTATAGDLSTDLVRAAGVRYFTDGDPLDYVLAGVVLDGTVRLRTAGHEVRLARNDGFLYPVNAGYTNDCHNPALVDVRLPLGIVRRMAAETSGLPAEDLRFQSLNPASEPLRRFWAGTVTGLHRQLAVSELVLPSLLAAEMLRVAAAAVVAVFPNTTMTAARLPPPGRVEPAVVRRARAFIEAHADRPLQLAQIADASGVGVRALQFAFRQHLDTTPMAYLRRVRLEHVRADLRAATPSDGTTVAAVARRWGFGNLSRFAGDYRAAFGELPSRTRRT
ncbi:AraC family transcriptional regulator [Actinoplanes sp. LDG1-06]|uniref:AraC family transcriptional regulator n=1 Tax=Paractinoplanes ovalisporus TaxID=2810368 RepID=A0ABS2A4H8_9ACTN|nr:helix-turn-helix transcriptional regulator [Actinoplanes ovalisporus]MBM2614760.1 AraC family transcriptional regulator [Actinoplanes ovalisporus]